MENQSWHWFSQNGVDESTVETKAPTDVRFGNGRTKRALNIVGIPVILGGQRRVGKFAAIDAAVPVLIGMDILDAEDAAMAFRKGILVLPQLSDKLFRCHACPQATLRST